MFKFIKIKQILYDTLRSNNKLHNDFSYKEYLIAFLKCVEKSVCDFLAVHNSKDIPPAFCADRKQGRYLLRLYQAS
jgi:hypothetical protein